MGVIKEYTPILGRESEQLVKEKLWKYGYSVKHFGKQAHFDLLVEDKYKVEVKSASPIINKNTIRWQITIPPPHYVDYWDVQAYVFYQLIGKPKILFFTKEIILKYFLNHTGIGFSTKNEEYWKLGNKSPYKVFGKPNVK